MKTKKLFITILAIFAVSVFFGCKPTVTPKPDETTPPAETPGNTPAPGTTETPAEPVKDPTASLFGNRYDDLDFIFNNQTLGKTTLQVRRSQWNQLLKNYDYFYKNENCVKGIKYTYEKDGKSWEVPNFGFRLRGNTSRYKPQGKSTPTDASNHTMPNYEWDKSYYAYAENCDDDEYRQAHFKIDFEEFLPEGEEFKLSNCMKGVALKRMDSICTREIMCYDLFHKFGIWTAPRASHTRVIFQFVEDVDTNGNVIDDISNCKITKVDFGVYEMFEEVNKQSLKARDEDNNKAETTSEKFWKNNKGNLWKCAGGDLTNPDVKFGVEDIRITEFAADGTPLDLVWDVPTYDLKTNKDNLESAAAEFSGFIRDLNNLPKTADTSADIDKIKEFYEKWFDVEFFLKSYAVNILCGMDDDYMGNANNYYLYFDTGSKKATNQVYFIPFDYDNTLGHSIKNVREHGGVADGFLQNPLDWGRGQNRPLLDRLLLVPDYKEMFKRLLQEVSSADGPWNFDYCSSRFLSWKTMVEPYLKSPDIKTPAWPNVGTYSWDDPISWGTPAGYPLTVYSNNIYDATRDSFLRWTSDFNSITFDLNGGNIGGKKEDIKIDSPDKTKTLSELAGGTPKKDGYIFTGWTKTKDGEDYTTLATSEYVYARWKEPSEIDGLFIYEDDDSDYDGIKIGIVNIPEGNDVRVRNIYINGKQVSRDDVYNDYDRNLIIRADKWGFPYTEAGKSYEIYISYQTIDSNYGWHEFDGNTSNKITITAKRGKGELKVSNEPNFEIKNNIITFNPLPVLNYNISGEYRMDLNTVNWSKWQSYDPIDLTSGKANLADHFNKNNPPNIGERLHFALRWFYKDADHPNYGTYWFAVYEWDDKTQFTVTAPAPITFNLNGGNIDGNKKDITITPPLKTTNLSSVIDNPKKTGYIFAGWTTKKDGDIYVKTSTDALATNGTLYAKWISYDDLATEITDLFIYEIDDPTYDGIKIKILNRPYGEIIQYCDWDTYSTVYSRYIYVNGNRVSNNESYSEWELNVLNATEWGFPYTESGKEYEVYVEYEENWGNRITSNKIKIEATSGKGELYTKNKPKYSITNNVITFNPAPELSLTPFESTSKYIMDLRTTGWKYQGEEWGYNPAEPFDFGDLVKNANSDNKASPGNEMMFQLRVQYEDPDNPSYGHYWHLIYDREKENYFTLGPLE